MIKKCWFRQRSYVHFDRVLSKKDALSLVTKNVGQHAFWPLIVRPMKSVYREKTNIGRRIIKSKKRPIAYAAHSDSYIYSYYAKLLYKRLEEEYKKNSLCDEAVLAYRAFTPPKSNINFASETFSYIKAQESCEVITLDIEGFFDNLEHQKLKIAWQNLLECKFLPKDHYAVFKASTRCYGIELHKLRDLFGRDLRTKRRKSTAAICTPSEFREKVVPEIRALQILVNEIKGENNPEAITKGIPQGLPISAVLANLYMLEADKQLTQCMDDMGGIYRRYSDDILLVVPQEKGSEAIQSVLDILEGLKLTIQEKKTKRVIVSRNIAVKEELNIVNQLNDKQCTTVSYLGFEFDGNNIFVRQSSISKFMVMAKRAIDNAVIAAKTNRQPLKKRKLYTRLTNLGYGKVYGKKVFVPQNELPPDIPRLGFFKYLSSAAKITNSEAIYRQKEQIKNRVIRSIKEAEKNL